MDQYIDAIKCLVRPIVTYLVILALIAVLVFLVVKFADADMAKTVVTSFLVLVASITGFWFASRARPPTPPTPPTQ